MEEDLLYQVGTLKGHFSRKENRAQKLIHQWHELENKLEGMVARGGGTTEQARLAYAVLVIMDTGIRVGNESSAEGWICENQIVAKKDGVSKDGKAYKEGDVIYRHPMYGQHVSTYGVTTLLNKHVSCRSDGEIHLLFTGKKLVDQELKLRRVILHTYFPFGEDPENSWLGIDYNLLKKFVKKYIGSGYTPKDIRTATVNKLFINLFSSTYGERYEAAERKGERKAILGEAIAATAERIGHTKGVCRSAYLSPVLLDTIVTQY